MEEQKPKEVVLKRVRDSLIDKMENPFVRLNLDLSIFANAGNADIVGFVNKFIETGGQFCFCQNIDHFRVNIAGLYESMGWDNIFCRDDYMLSVLEGCGMNIISTISDLKSCKTTLTGCDYLIARTGSIMATSKTLMSRKLHVFPDNHIVYAHMPQLVPDLKTALNNIVVNNRMLPSMIVNITGGSRTADIEKTLVRPAHGACNVYLFLIDG